MRNKSFSKLLLLCAGLLILILDASTAIKGVKEGIDLCIRTVIPALFPFFVLLPMLTGAVTGVRIPPLRFLGCPEGAESIYLIGLLGGYPMGAQSVFQNWKAGTITTNDAHRMLGFCSNAGPAFLFGIAGTLFDEPYIPWMLWIIHILSSIFVALILPGKSNNPVIISAAKDVTISNAVNTAAKSMALVCSWVILLRVIITFTGRWFLWMLPETAQHVFIGILELSNGCCDLIRLQNHGLRYLLCSFFLGFGGLCVAMQTVSVTGELGTGYYFPGKMLQGCISLILAGVLQQFLFSPADRVAVPVWIFNLIMILCIILAFGIRIRKKSSSIPACAGV